MKRNLFLLTGPSGVGKTTIADKLLEADEDLSRVVTYTTREPREGEVDGVHYNFVDHAKFEAMIEAGEMLEYATVYKNYYGQTIKSVEDIKNSGKDVLLTLDPQGAKTIMEKDIGAISFFVDAESEEVLMERLSRRGEDSEEQIQKRLEDIQFDRSHQEYCTYHIINREGELEATVKKIQDIIEKHREGLTSK